MESKQNTKVTAAGMTGGLLVEALQTVVFALAISVIVYLFLAIPNQVEGSSMMPNLQDDEVLLTNKFIQIAGGPEGVFKDYDYQRGDIVVFQQPSRPDLVKRVIGLPGDLVELQDGHIIINDQILIEDYIDSDVRTDPADFLTEGREKRVPDDSYFVMGDNRTNSRDSRTKEVGFVKRKYLKGSPFLRILPLNRFGLLGRGEYKWLEESEVLDTGAEGDVDVYEEQTNKE